MSLENFSEFMSTEEIFNAWSELQADINILLEAVKNRLSDLGYDEYSDNIDENEEDENEEIRSLLDLQERLYENEY